MGVHLFDGRASGAEIAADDYTVAFKGPTRSWLADVDAEGWLCRLQRGGIVNPEIVAVREFVGLVDLLDAEADQLGDAVADQLGDFAPAIIFFGPIGEFASFDRTVKGIDVDHNHRVV